MRYEITAPDGTRFEVSAPDGATADQVLEYAKQQFGARSPSFVDELGVLDASLISAGRTTDKVLQGVRQLWNRATGTDAALASQAERERENDRVYAPLKQRFPVSTAIGEALPALAVPIGGTGAAFVGRSALAGAVPGLLSYGDDAERMKRAGVGAAGGAVGGAIGLGIGRALQPLGKDVGISQSANDAARRLNLPLTAGQVSQTPALQNFENYLLRSPGSSGLMQGKRAAFDEAINTAAASAIGQKASSGGVDEGVFAAAKNAIGAEFDRLAGITRPTVGNDFVQTLLRLEQSNMARGPYRSAAIDKQIEKGLDLAAQGQLTGVAYKQIRTQLSTEAQKAFAAGDSTLGQAIKDIRASLDDAAKASLSNAEQKAWDLARKQWAAYKTLTRGNVAEAGNVSPARVASALRQQRQGDAFRTGDMSGPLADIGRVGEAVKSAQNPNSGQLMQQMLYGNPLTGVPMMVGNNLIGKAYMAQPVQQYLSGGLLSNPAALEITRRAALPVAMPLLPTYLGAE